MVVQFSKSGYRSTEIGTLPEEWTVSSLRDSCDLIKDGTHTPPRRIMLGIPLLSAVNIENGEIDFHNNLTYISEKDYQSIHKFYSIKRGDILITIVGTLGRAALVNSDQKFSVQRSIAILRPHSSIIDNEYFFHIMNSKKSQEQIQLFSKATAQAGIYLSELAKILIPIPKIQEQRGIAKILLNVDALIKSFDVLITKKKNIKQGLMQRLLTRGIGHTKFKKTEIGEIPDEWTLKRLGELISLEYGTGLPSGNRKGERYPVFGSNGVIGYYSDFHKDGPGIIVGRKGSIGKVTWSDENFWPIDTTYYVKLKSNLDLRWLFYKLTNLTLERLNTATGVPGLNRDSVYNLLIGLPGFTQQQTISKILLDADEEIKALEQKRDKYKMLKTGMMQQLLTGRIRVK